MFLEKVGEETEEGRLKDLIRDLIDCSSHFIFDTWPKIGCKTEAHERKDKTKSLFHC